jgi:hypothetical protein
MESFTMRHDSYVTGEGTRCKAIHFLKKWAFGLDNFFNLKLFIQLRLK